MTTDSRQAGIELQKRDFGLLRDLFESRLMTLAHVTALHFDGKAEAAKKRLQKLKGVGLLAERRRRVYEPSVLSLTSAAIKLLIQEGITSTYPKLALATIGKRTTISELTLRHELQVMDVKAAVVAAVRPLPNFRVAEFSTWPMLYEFQSEDPDGKEVTVKPDGFIRIHEANDEEQFEHTFFLEVDRSTETQETLAEKAYCYRDFYRRGGLAVRNGRPRLEYESFPFRVLMVLRTAERRNNAAERLLGCRPPILTQVWLTTFPEMIGQSLGAIWVRPVDFRTTIDGTSFAKVDEGPTYRQRQKRETIAEASLKKQALLPQSP